LAKLSFAPLTIDRWDDFETLFGPRGACAGCWCMWWRLPKAEFEQSKGASNRDKMQRIVRDRTSPGILAYSGREPVGWCAVAPRADYGRLAKARVLKPIDDQPVWSVTCLFVRRDTRKQGVSSALLSAAADFARERGASIIEGYPVVPRDGSIADVFAFTGLPSAFERAGFREVARPSPSRPIMRLQLAPNR
jgi:GNAT superfamily N-acetyltransferase